MEAYKVAPDLFSDNDDCVLLAVSKTVARSLGLEKCSDLCKIMSGTWWIRVPKNTSYRLIPYTKNNIRHPTKWEPGDEVIMIIVEEWWSRPLGQYL